MAWLLTAVILVGLSAVFAGYGVFMLAAAYRISDLYRWGRLACMGGVSLILGGLGAMVAATLVAQHW